jgi:hypothetical protein
VPAVVSGCFSQASEQLGDLPDGRGFWLVAGLDTGLDALQEQRSCLQVSVKKVYRVRCGGPGP